MLNREKLRGSARKRLERESKVVGRRDVWDGVSQVGIRACLILGWIDARKNVIVRVRRIRKLRDRCVWKRK